jgi:hypothetical protein
MPKAEGDTWLQLDVVCFAPIIQEIQCFGSDYLRPPEWLFTKSRHNAPHELRPLGRFAHHSGNGVAMLLPSVTHKPKDSSFIP